jgi:hypothetical protein
MSNTEIDAVDYGIMKCIEEHDNVWKKRVHNLVLEHQEKLPHMEEISVQTIGRRINKMQEADLLESCILSPDDLNRDLIIGYNVTDEGLNVLAEKREKFLRSELLYIGERLLGNHDTVDTAVSRAVLVELICDEFRIPASIRDNVIPECDTMELSVLLGMYYFRKEVPQFISRDALGRLVKIIRAAPQMQNVFGGETIVERLFSTVNAETADTAVGEIDVMH